MSQVAYLKDALWHSPDSGQRIRFVTATSLFDGHDASINVMRRILQTSGVEVIHLGHNRSVREIVNAAIEEDAQGIAVSSYQGGHIEFFKYMLDMLRDRNRDDIHVFGGGGGVIVPDEIRELEEYGISRIYSPTDGQKMGLKGMIDDMLYRVSSSPANVAIAELDDVKVKDHGVLARLITAVENKLVGTSFFNKLGKEVSAMTRAVPVVGITGTGGAGKSSLTDELIQRWRRDYQDTLQIAILAVDPSRKKTGGALLGDRIRMNAIETDTVFMRSLATRTAESQIPDHLPQLIALVKLAGFDLVIIETPGIGQGDSSIVQLADLAVYVMTPEFGSASQLEKIDMLDFANFVAINKFDRRGAEDAYRDVSKQLQRNQMLFDRALEEMPVYRTTASHFNDVGVSRLYHAIQSEAESCGLPVSPAGLEQVWTPVSKHHDVIIPTTRQSYLAEIAKTMREYRRRVEELARSSREIQQLRESAKILGKAGRSNVDAQGLAKERELQLDEEARALLRSYSELQERYGVRDETAGVQRDRATHNELFYTSLSGTRFPKVSLPRYTDEGDRLRWLMLENIPGSFPFTAGVFSFKRENEAPTRMFAGEGDAFRTNRRFKFLSKEFDAKRLSTAFDSVTLYGSDPHPRPDIYGKVGTSGVSIATVDDMKTLYDGFDLCDSQTSVSMTINGPAPIILAFFLNTAIDQQMERYLTEHGSEPNAKESARIRAWTLENVRGTVQADILKEDQGQNTCLFSTEFSLRMMGDIQQYFIDHNVKHFYSVSISGFHIAEAGANPITQLAFTLANGFTYIEAYLARGMKIDDFAPRLSFFFSSGMDPEYTVIGRVARRIWAVAIRDRYGGNQRSQKLKYHIQTSGRSLHAQEMSFNDIRTTLQALIAVYDNCNSLHTNAHDEAVTTPSEASVRRALAIQMIINDEWGFAKGQNVNQGSFFIEDLTDLVEEAVLAEFDRISNRGGVLGAMETGYQRGKIQEESLYYEQCKHDGSYPIIGVNTFLDNKVTEESEIELSRGTDEERVSQLERLSNFHRVHADKTREELRLLQQTALDGRNTFAQLMASVRHCSLGQITSALFEVGGKYRRNM